MPKPAAVAEPQATWGFVTNHAMVLLLIHQDPDIRMRDVATTVGITERAVQRIVAELEGAGYLTITRAGRRNSYLVPHKHPAGIRCPVVDPKDTNVLHLLMMLGGTVKS